MPKKASTKTSDRKGSTEKQPLKKKAVFMVGIAFGVAGVGVLFQMLKKGVRDPAAELDAIAKEMEAHEELRNKSDLLAGQLQGRLQDLETSEQGFSEKLAKGQKLEDELRTQLNGEENTAQVLSAKVRSFGHQEAQLTQGLSALDREEAALRKKLEELARQEKLLEGRLAQGAS